MTRARRNSLALLALAVSVLLVARAARKRHGALERNYIFSGRVLAGEDPYATPVHSPYPPSYGLVMGPLRLLPLTGARIAWALLQIVMLGVLIALCARWWRSLGVIRGPPPLWLTGIALLLVSRYLWRDTAGGGGNLVFGTCVLLACVRPGERPGEDRKPWTGLLLGLVLAAKPTPLLFLPWLWLRGRHRTLLVAVLTATVLHAAPLLTLGADGWMAAYGRWADGVWRFGTQADLFALPELDFPKFTWMHQSLRYCVARYFGAVPSEHALDSALFFQGLALPHGAVRAVQLTLTVVLLGATWAVLYRRRASDSPFVELSAPSALVALTLLLSPITWKSYHVQLFPAFFLMLAWSEVATRRQREITVGLVAYFVLCVALSEFVIGKLGKNVMQSLYVVTFGAGWVWLLTLRLVAREVPVTAPPRAADPPRAGGGPLAAAR